ncbi:hypothetical protein HHK36_014524 [Tetracentron sinense]|uniref:RNA 3'-terminal phosphate cyclase insert domain-containing protein n=1 Tax=Tetracentron sinense TaxID=13715 RepID=A0A834Z0B3_TETSI|nr:hypothetical protein HHK36_014524 [Tetracentron sinense]
MYRNEIDVQTRSFDWREASRARMRSQSVHRLFLGAIDCSWIVWKETPFDKVERYDALVLDVSVFLFVGAEKLTDAVAQLILVSCLNFGFTSFNVIKRFGDPSEGLELKIESRGSPPQGGGEVILAVPIIQNMTWVDDGMVKRIRGVTFSTRVSSQFENTMIHAVRGIFNRLLPDVHISTDHKAGLQAGKSPGYGISLVAETTSGCFISADIAVSYARGEDTDALEDEERKERFLRYQLFAYNNR